MGKNSKSQGDAAPAPEDDDELLAAAILQSQADRAKLSELDLIAHKAKMATAAAGGKKKNRAKAAASKVGKVLTMPETLAKLDRVMIFHIFKLCDDGSKDVCPSLNGEVTFYVDAAEVRAEVEALKATDAALQVGIDHVPLSRAFALTQGLMGLQAPGAIQMKLQFSKAITAAEGGAGIPEALREKMSGRGPFPMFYSDKIVVPNCQPIFFTRSDLAEFWVGAGGSPDAVPEPVVTDLRIVVTRTLQEAGSWASLLYVPPKSSAALAKELIARTTLEKKTADGFASGGARLKEVARAVAVADGEEPPPLDAPAEVN